MPADVVLPPSVVTLTVTEPVPAGDSALICVDESTVYEVAGVPPKFTTVAPVKPVPVITTIVPPDSGPLPGARAEIVGTGTYVYVPKDTAVPFAVVMLRLTAPVPAGATAVIWEAELTT